VTEGRTGVPYVDANMRELSATGFMSNRGRQNVASFLTKDLQLDWRLGAEWFESQLVCTAFDFVLCIMCNPKIMIYISHQGSASGLAAGC
jgi:hypothetical protein